MNPGDDEAAAGARRDHRLRIVAALIGVDHHIATAGLRAVRIILLYLDLMAAAALVLVNDGEAAR